MQGKTKTTFINQSELEQRLNNQIKPTSFRLISGLEYTVAIVWMSMIHHENFWR